MRAASTGSAAQLRGVLRLARSLATIEDEQTLLATVVSAARSVLGYSACMIALRGDDGNYHHRASAGMAPDDERRMRTVVVPAAVFEALSHSSITLGAVHWVPAAHAVRARADVKASVLSTEVSVPSRTWEKGSILFAPLLDSEGRTIGYLNPDDPLSGDLPALGQTLMLETLAELTVLGLEIVRSRTTERAARAVVEAQRGQLEALLTASSRVRGDVGLDEVLGTIAHAMTNAGGFNRAAVYLLVDGLTLVVRATVGLSDAEDAELQQNTVTLAEFSPVTKPEMLVSRSYLFDHRYHKMPDELADKFNTPIADPNWHEGQWHVEDMLVVPLVAVSGEVLGLISLDEPKNGLLPDRPHVQALEFFADQCATAVVAAREFEAVRAEAHTDPLTGLANRRALLIALDRAVARHLRGGEPASVLFADIDHFKHDQRHPRPRHRRRRPAVDRAGARASACAGTTSLPATAARSSSPSCPTRRSRRRRRSPRSCASASPPSMPRRRPGRCLLRISIGVAGVSGRLATAGEVLAAADAAMYVAKRSGRNNVSVAAA